MQFACLTLGLSTLYTKHYVELLPPDNKHSVVKRGTGDWVTPLPPLSRCLRRPGVHACGGLGSWSFSP